MNPIKKLRLLGTFTLVLLGTLPMSAPAINASETPTTAVAEQDAEARELLLKMADVLSQAAGFSVTIRSSYDSIQEDGQRIEFGERRNILLQRPDRLRVEVERSDGDLALVIFDGQTITVFKADDNIYAQVEKPGSVDAAVVHLVKNLQTPFPLARMFLTTLSKDMRQWIESVNFVEEDTLTDPPTTHLAGHSEDVDLQIWVGPGDRPLPQRIVLTYRSESGQPQFRADFINWTLAPETDASSFTFVPPKNAEQILFLAPVRENSLPAGQEGEKP